MNNEEKILQMLEGLTETVNRQGTQLAEQGKQLTEQGKQLAEMQETLTRVAVTQEGVVLPRIQLALEGHSELVRKMDTLATKEQVEALSDSVDVVKAVVRQHSGEIGELKKAQ